MVLKFPTEKEGVEVCIARPGVIANSSTWSRALVANLFRIVNLFGQPLPYVQRSQLAAAVLIQVMDGFEKQTLSNADLVRIGQREMNSRSIPQPSWIFLRKVIRFRHHFMLFILVTGKPKDLISGYQGSELDPQMQQVWQVCSFARRMEGNSKGNSRCVENREKTWQSQSSILQGYRLYAAVVVDWLCLQADLCSFAIREYHHAPTDQEVLVATNTTYGRPRSNESNWCRVAECLIEASGFCDAFIPRIETYPEHTWTSRGVRHTVYCLQVAKSRSNSIWGKFLPKARPSGQYQTSFCCKLSNIDYGLYLSDLGQIDLDQISRPIITIPIDGNISIFDIPTERQRPCAQPQNAMNSHDDEVQFPQHKTMATRSNTVKFSQTPSVYIVQSINP